MHYFIILESYYKVLQHLVWVRDLYKHYHYMGKSVFAIRLVNLQLVTCYTDQNLKSTRSFLFSKSLFLEKRV